jgi:hypothetical protein
MQRKINNYKSSFKFISYWEQSKIRIIVLHTPKNEKLDQIFCLPKNIRFQNMNYWIVRSIM